MVLGSGSYEASLVIDPKPTSTKQFRNIQLPSPISPSTTSSPSLPGPSSPPLASAALPTSELDIASTSSSRGNLVPIKSFVHEVLRRSRTSGCVLQTALCYLEAIRSKVPELVRAEQAGEGVQGEEDQSDWITPPTAEELEREAQLTLTPDSDAKASDCEDDSLVATVRVDDSECSFSQSRKVSPAPPLHQRLPPRPMLPPLPPLPSPLLCPRRAFLASLILASKFTQDKCYSNRAWAKLSGLPPREIGRCERALGDALDWRLWVGKQPSATPPSPTLPTVTPASRTIARSQSESCLLPTTQGSFLVRQEQLSNPSLTVIPENRGLRRRNTLHADAFVTMCPAQVPSGQAPWRTSVYVSSQSHEDNGSSDEMDCSNQTTPMEPLLEMGNDHGPPTSACCSFSDKINQSPSPQTPNLTYSPSSTESCSGDRTVQMTSFLDEPNTLTSSHLIGSDSWLWLDSSEVCTSIPQLLPSSWQKTSPLVNDPFEAVPDGVPSGMDFGGPSPFQLTDGASIYPWISASDNAATAVYPLHW
ncbi:hypothetical protein H0H87_011151 [Tephrocybe sp. NHM501043]|nr:hypothetical protein H0H87_011151 [Tephrocybe sp. NHM501043]